MKSSALSCIKTSILRFRFALLEAPKCDEDALWSRWCGKEPRSGEEDEDASALDAGCFFDMPFARGGVLEAPVGLPSSFFESPPSSFGFIAQVPSYIDVTLSYATRTTHPRRHSLNATLCSLLGGDNIVNRGVLAYDL